MIDIELLPARIRAKIEIQEECWVWTGCIQAGYGYLHADGATRRAHRWIYDKLVGPIPTGLVLHHICHNTACVNPEHLEPVTQWQNIIADPASRSISRVAALRTHCSAGHEYTPANTKVCLSRPGVRYCKTCAAAWMRLHRAAKRDAA